MITLRFRAEWPGEMAAGLRPGSEEVEITFKHTDSVSEDGVDFLKEELMDFFDGAHVEFMGWDKSPIPDLKKVQNSA